MENEKEIKKPKLSQADLILEWFKYHEKIDRLQASSELGVFELSARIYDPPRRRLQ